MSPESTMLSTDITCKEILKILTNKDASRLIRVLNITE